MRLLPIPRFDKLAGDLGSLGPMCLHDDEASGELYRRLDVRNHFQPILTS